MPSLSIQFCHQFGLTAAEIQSIDRIWSHALAKAAPFLGYAAPKIVARRAQLDPVNPALMNAGPPASKAWAPVLQGRTARAISPSPTPSPPISRRGGSRPATACRRSASSPAAWARFHDGRARLCRGGQARAGRIDRRARHVRPAQRDGARRARPPRSRADFSMNMPPEPDDPAILARMRDGFAAVSADLGSLCATRASVVAADRTRRRPGSDGARWCPRRSASSSPRRAWRDGRHLQPARQSRRSGLCESDHLSGRARDRRAARVQTDRGRDGPRRRNPGGAGGERRATRRRRSISIRHCKIRRRSPSPSAGAPRSARSRAAQRPDRRGRRLWLHPDPWAGAARRDRARHLLAHRRARQMHRRRAAACLCRRADARAGWSFNSAMRALRDGLAGRGGGRDALDQRRHRRHDPAVHPRGDDGAPADLPRGSSSRAPTCPTR